MRRPGFTLVELIVVMGIITFLMALTVPGLHYARRQARAVCCGTNIKQLLLALAMYETENESLPYSFDDTFARMMNPPPAGFSGYDQSGREGWWWFHYMPGLYSKAHRQETILLCPSKRLTDHRLQNNILCGNYGVNQSLCKMAQGRKSRTEFIGAPLSTTELAQPGRTLLIVDSGFGMTNWWHAIETPPEALSSTIEDSAYIPGLGINRKKTNLRPGQGNDAENGRHPNRTVNVGFADGHVRRTRAEALLVEESGDGFKNRSPLWRAK